MAFYQSPIARCSKTQGAAFDAPHLVEGPGGDLHRNGPRGPYLTWNLSGVAAAGITITGGVLAFATSPNDEASADADMSNEYLLTMEVSEGIISASINATITVTDVDEAPVEWNCSDH